MRHSRTAEEIGTVRVEQAARERRPRQAPDLERDIILALPRPAHRDPQSPAGQPDTGQVNGRPPGGWPTAWPFALLPPADGEWEREAVTAARLAGRAAAAADLAGLVTA